MVFRYTPNLVSQYTDLNTAAAASHAHYEGVSFRATETRAFIKAACEALGATHFNIDYASAVLYRPGETHVLGEIGFKDVRVKGGGASAPSYYVRAKGIRNDKYRDTVWQHNIIATKSMKNAVKHAVEHLTSTTPKEAMALTANLARTIIERAVAKHYETSRDAYRQLFGDSGYGNTFELPIYSELRYTPFSSPQLNQLVHELVKHIDTWREAKSITEKGIHYVGMTGNDEQMVVDVAHCGSRAYNHEEATVTRYSAAEIPEWVQGRIAVLQMVERGTYVPGVGLRLDDRVYYIMEDSAE